MLFSAREHLASHWLDLAEGRLRLDRLNRNGGGETFLARARNGQSPGEESLAAAVAVQAIEAQPAFGQIEPKRGQVLACAEQHLGDVPAIDRPTQEILVPGEGRDNLARRKAAPRGRNRPKHTRGRVTTGSKSTVEIAYLQRSARGATRSQSC